MDSARSGRAGKEVDDDGWQPLQIFPSFYSVPAALFVSEQRGFARISGALRRGSSSGHEQRSGRHFFSPPLSLCSLIQSLVGFVLRSVL